MMGWISYEARGRDHLPARIRLGWDRSARGLSSRCAFLLLFGMALILLASPASAQVQVDIALKRNLYIRYEPILATVTITNLTGSELSLADAGQQRWFGIEVETLDGRPIPPVGDYSNQPLELGPQQKISRTVNITPLFPISEFGGYRVRATVFVHQSGRHFTSPSLNFEVTDGRMMWQKTVGVPEGTPGAGTSRTVTLLSHRLPESTQLYIRIEDPQAGRIYCTHQLGKFLSFGNPNVMLDRQNQIHILQNSAPKVFFYSQIGLNGEVLDRRSYNELSSRPALRRGSDGSVVVVGGQAYDPKAAQPEKTLPSMGDRPVELPGSTPKPPADEKRPENLLSR